LANKLHKVQYRVNFNRDNRPDVYTDLEVDKKYWNNGKVGKRHPNADIINRALRQLRNRAEEAETKYKAKVLNSRGVLAFLGSKSESDSIDGFIEDFVKKNKKDVTYQVNKDHYNAFKKFMGIKKPLKFNDINIELFNSFKIKAEKEIRQRDNGYGGLSDRSLNNYGAIIPHLCNYAFANRIIYDKIDIPENLYTFEQQKKINPRNYTEDFIETLKNVNSIQRWQSLALWLLQFSLRGVGNADIVRISDRLVVDQQGESMTNKAFTKDIWLNYGRSKTRESMLIRLYPVMLMLIKYIKNSVVYTHIDHKIGGKTILSGLEDRINIFEYDNQSNGKEHLALWKIRSNKFNDMQSKMKFKYARNTFEQIAELKYGTVYAKKMIGQDVDKLTGVHYSNYHTPEAVKQMDKRHKEVLEEMKFETLVKLLIVKLTDLVAAEKVPNWVLVNGGITKSGNSYKMLTSEITITPDGKYKIQHTNKLVETNIESKYHKYFKNYKDVDVDLPENSKNVIFEKIAKQSIKEVNNANKVIALYDMDKVSEKA